MLRWLVALCWLCACNQIFHIPDVHQSNDACGDGLAKCDPNASCTDTSSGYACACNMGYDGNGLTCTDVDECSMSPAPCDSHATCTNTPGSFTCACDTGYIGDGTTCAPSSFKKIAAAGGFTCAVGTDGGLYCWGSNDFGQLGDGTYLPHARPVQVGTDTTWIDVDARFLKACGLKADHSVWCWGYGETGMLGDGQQKTENAPTMVISDKPGVGFKALSVGKPDVCAIHDDGSLACWGQDRITGAIHTKPVAVDANTDWTAIAVGNVHCGLRNTTGGNLYCWGKSQFVNGGDLGQGNVQTVMTPTRVGTDTWSSVAMGYYNGCAIRQDGTLWCWGTNMSLVTSLQYGTAPMQIGTASNWTKISVSIDTIAALGGGTLFVWGDNLAGQLGLQNEAEIVNPTPIGGTITGWLDVHAGNSHQCGITPDHGYCWGAIGDGDIGNGVTVNYYSPTQIGTSRWMSISLGSANCGINDALQVECWGNVPQTGVGFGNTDPVWAPTILSSINYSFVRANTGSGGATFCGVHVGNLACWGDNSTGQDAQGNTTSPQLSPIDVGKPPGGFWLSVDSTDHTCAITNANQLYCWGDNTNGELGTGTTSTTPTTTIGTALAGTWKQVAVGGAANFNGSNTCGIKFDGTLWCWGADQYPDVANAHMVPTQVGTATNWTQIATIQTETCGVRGDGTLWCWGTIVGDGSQNASATPHQVGTDTDWASVGVGSEVCAIKTTGTMWCFANEFSTPLGNGKDMTDFVTLQIPVTLTPVQIGTDTDWGSVSPGGGGMSCALKKDGTLWCWGDGAAPIPQFVAVPTLID